MPSRADEDPDDITPHEDDVCTRDDCGHMAVEHADLTGACEHDGCACRSFVADADAEGADDTADPPPSSAPGHKPPAVPPKPAKGAKPSKADPAAEEMIDRIATRSGMPRAKIAASHRALFGKSKPAPEQSAKAEREARWRAQGLDVEAMRRSRAALFGDDDKGGPNAA